MKPKKIKLIVIGLLFLGVALLSFGALFKNSNSVNYNQNPAASNNLTNQKNKIQDLNSNSSKLILFYGQGCPHCANVEDYLKSNPPKFNLEQKEVYYNQNNQKELISQAKSCGLPENQIGVPFLWTGKDCIIGDTPIINYFKNLNNNL